MSCRLGTLGEAGAFKGTTVDEFARKASEDSKEKCVKSSSIDWGRVTWAHGDKYRA